MTVRARWRRIAGRSLEAEMAELIQQGKWEQEQEAKMLLEFAQMLAEAAPKGPETAGGRLMLLSTPSSDRNWLKEQFLRGNPAI